MTNLNTIDIKVTLHLPDAVVPTYATDGSGAMDLYAAGLVEDGCTIGPDNPTAVVNTGIAVEIPKGYGLFVLSRSGQGFNADVRLANCVGLVDSDYRGTVFVKLTADGQTEYTIKNGDRIAQACVIPLPRINLVTVDSLTDTARGQGGFGSTGK